jgi:hypothetical protein
VEIGRFWGRRHHRNAEETMNFWILPRRPSFKHFCRFNCAWSFRRYPTNDRRRDSSSLLMIFRGVAFRQAWGLASLNFVLVETHNHLLAKVLFQIADDILSDDDGPMANFVIGKLLYPFRPSVAGDVPARADPCKKFLPDRRRPFSFLCPSRN